MLEVKVSSHCGMPTLCINGKPSTGLMHFNKTSNSEEAANFRSTGISLFSFIGNLYLPGPSAENDNGGNGAGMAIPTMTPEHIDATMNALIDGNPDILVMPRIRMISPAWWNERHPEELMRHYFDGEYKSGPLPSMVSQKWLDDSLNALAETIRYFEKNWSDRVIGYHTGYGECAEQVYAWNGRLSDYSRIQLDAFRQWLKEKYQTAENLQYAWNHSSIDFAQAEIPSPEQRQGMDPSGSLVIYDPQTEQNVIDYQTFHSEAVAATVVAQAVQVKNTLRELDRKKIYGVFYAYVSFPTNCRCSHYNSGHDAHETVLNCPDIDFICSPLGYSSRQAGGCCTPQVLSGSIAAHGKLYYAEDDTGTHLTPGHHHGLIPGSAAEFINITRRNFMANWSSGSSQWWMDLRGGKWFHDKSILQEISRMRQFAEQHISNRNSIAQVVVFISDLNMSYQRQLPVALSGILVEHTLNELSSIGAPFDLFRLEDIPLMAKAGKLDQYRLCVFLNAFEVSDHIRNHIDSTLKKDDRTLVWSYLPGIINKGKFDLKAAEELTGMRYTLIKDMFRDSIITEYWQNGHRFTYGSERNIFPRLTGIDPEAETQGYYVEGTQYVRPSFGTDVALMSKQLAGWKSVWSGAPDIPGVLMADWARESGVHCYSDQGDQILAGPGWLGIHAKSSGDKNIILPQKYTVTDFITGTTVTENRNTINLSLKRGESRLVLLK